MHLSPSLSTFGTEAGSPTEPKAHWFCYSSSLACSRDPISTSIPGSLGGMGLGRIQTLFLRHVTRALPTEPLEKTSFSLGTEMSGLLCVSGVIS